MQEWIQGVPGQAAVDIRTFAVGSGDALDGVHGVDIELGANLPAEDTILAFDIWTLSLVSTQKRTSINECF
jgi:hypothetical protein